MIRNQKKQQNQWRKVKKNQQLKLFNLLIGFMFFILSLPIVFFSGVLIKSLALSAGIGIQDSKLYGTIGTLIITPIQLILIIKLIRHNTAALVINEEAK